MKTATVAQLKKELQYRSPEEVAQLCLRLARFKKENKELLTYLLFESESEEGYMETVKAESRNRFRGISSRRFTTAGTGIR